MSVEEDVVKAKENLQNALGERFNEYEILSNSYFIIFLILCFDSYMQSMRKWFSGKVFSIDLIQNKNIFVLVYLNIITNLSHLNKSSIGRQEK